jgi:hypothetical protein
MQEEDSAPDGMEAQQIHACLPLESCGFCEKIVSVVPRFAWLAPPKIPDFG